MKTTQETLSLPWAKESLGIPYKRGGVGPDSFDCLGLVQDYFLRVHGEKIDIVAGVDTGDARSGMSAILAASKSNRWQEQETPSTGDVVAMGAGRLLSHVGIWLEIDGGLCIHALDGGHVSAHRLDKLRSMNFSSIKFFRYV